MNAGDALLLAGCGAALVAAATAWSGRPAAERLGRRAVDAAALALGGATAWLALHFLLGWTDLAYVWDHTSITYPWYYRLAGLWGGERGTVTLWAALVAAFAAVEARRDRPEALARGVRAVLALLAFALGALAYADGAFAPTPPDLLAFRPGGQGLVEVLVTPLMVVHPPVQFVAYALLAVPAALAVAGVWTGEPWLDAAAAWARPAWVVATTGLGLGAIWAYYVLSFGGFWAWDPVEVANLLPWLALTAFLHASRDRDGVGAPVLAAAALALTLFAALSTRSGLWVSVHAFTDPADRFEPDAASRFVSILDAHFASGVFAGLLAATLAVASAAFGRALARRGARWTTPHAALLAVVAGVALAAPAPAYGAMLEAGRLVGFGRAAAGLGVLAVTLFAAPPLALWLGAAERPRRGGLAWVATAPLLKAASAVLALGLVVAFVLDLAVVNGADRAVFDGRAPFVGVPVLALVALAFGHRVLGPRRALAAVAAALAAGAVLALVLPAPWPVALAAPVLVVAFALVFARAVQALRGDVGRAETAAGALLLAGALVAVVVWANPPHALGVGFGPGALLLVLALAGVPGAVAALDGRARGVALAGAAAVALTFVGAPFALAAAALILRAPRREGRPAWGTALRRAGIHVVHLGLVVGLAGFAAATYASASGEFALAPGEHAVVGGACRTSGSGSAPDLGFGCIDYALAEVTGEPAGDGSWRRVEARLVGADGDGARSAFEWRGEPVSHYDPVLDVRRGLLRDVYVSPHAFEVAGLGLVREHTTPAFADLPRFSPENVERAHFDVVVLPLMSFVWGGLWTLVAGMGFVVVGRALEGRARRHQGA